MSGVEAGGGPRYFSRPLADADDNDFIGEIGAATADATWTVVNPQWLTFTTDEAREAHRLGPIAGYSAFRLTGRELAECIESAAIGFDWTELSLDTHGEATPLALDCIDSARWQARTSDDDFAALLLRLGFESMPDVEWMARTRDTPKPGEYDHAPRGTRAFAWLFLALPLAAVAIAMIVGAFDLVARESVVAANTLASAVPVGGFVAWLLLRGRK